MDKPAVLVLEDGTSFVGYSFGASGETFGEAVFSTGMTGYQETLTDPSYHRQILVATSPHIGNTGWNDEDDENVARDGRGRIWVAGYVVRDPSPRPSNWRSRRSLQDELEAQGIVGIAGIDTRALTLHLRERGAMRAGISSTGEPAETLLERVLASPSMVGADLVGEVTTPQSYAVPAVGQHRFTVAAVDLGIKANTPRLMAARGMAVHVLPASSSIDDIAALRPDGVFLSNGPGDPSTATHVIELTRHVLDANLPLFGICFGHQVFAQALGYTTYKLRFGHRGINQPVIDLSTGRVAITAHNHGFAVSPQCGDAGRGAESAISHVCLNDDVVEGLELRKDGKLAAFSVQYHPEAAAGPHDAQHLFDRFADLMEARYA